MHAGLHSRSSAHANKNHHSLRHSSSLEEGLTNVEEDANESKGRNNRRSSSKLGNGFGGGGSSFWGGGRGGSSPSYGPSVLRSTRDKFGKKDPSISVWAATALVRGHLNRVSVVQRGVLFRRTCDAKVMGIVK